MNSEYVNTKTITVQQSYLPFFYATFTSTFSCRSTFIWSVPGHSDFSQFTCLTKQTAHTSTRSLAYSVYLRLPRASHNLDPTPLHVMNCLFKRRERKKFISSSTRSFGSRWSFSRRLRLSVFSLLTLVSVAAAAVLDSRASRPPLSLLRRGLIWLPIDRCHYTGNILISDAFYDPRGL